jgi:hypothetical protein
MCQFFLPARATVEEILFQQQFTFTFFTFFLLAASWDILKNDDDLTTFLSKRVLTFALLPSSSPASVCVCVWRATTTTAAA